jgi:hypothetical protein
VLNVVGPRQGDQKVNVEQVTLHRR